MRPNEFWSRTDESRSWRFYVGLCELTSGLLDYATGLDLLRPKSPTEISANIWTLDASGRPERSLRLNWASTCFYYSLVHMGRLLVFLPLGDFPKGHDQLGKCFTEAAASEKSPKTSWLKRVACRLNGPRDEEIGVEGVRVDFSELGQFYLRELHSQETENALLRFGRVLRDAKELRENNNYEALLIAHEFNHRTMTPAFQILADNMKNLAREFLALTGRAFASHLATKTGRPWDRPADGKVGFAKDFLEDHVVNGISEWYGPETAAEIRLLTAPVAALDAPGDDAPRRQIQHDVEIGIFSPKKRLMDDFTTGASKLRDLLGEPSS